MANAFAKRGIGVLAYDKRGTGKSTGAFTGSDFKLLGVDAAHAVRFARTIKGVDGVGIWGHSQAGWIVPYAVDSKPRFAILVSPAGVNPYEQVDFFMQNQMKEWGLSDVEVARADSMHRSTTLYYAGRMTFEEAEKDVDANRAERWFRKATTHPYWHKMTPDGRLLSPDELQKEIARSPAEYEIYRSPSTFVDYAKTYEALSLPTLVIYGGADNLVPFVKSRAVLEPALKHAGASYEFRVFEGADHSIKGPDERVRADYLDYMTTWAASHFGTNRSR
jgi:alpha-beta hydrolase superfamily lysophospholipase